MAMLTKQGVKDLGNIKNRKYEFNPLNQCSHTKLQSCCTPYCGHIVCPDCELYIDVSYEMHGQWVW